MSDMENVSYGLELLERLSRNGMDSGVEKSVVASAGGRAAAWAVKVKSNSSYNFYNVRAVVVGAAGSIPVEIGAETEAVNLAESFIQTGQLSAGTYVAMFKVGDKNVFYAPV